MKFPVLLTFVLVSFLNSANSQTNGRLSYARQIPTYVSPDWSLFLDEAPKARGKKTITVEGNVKYERGDKTYSEYYFREIIFTTGVNLNASTESNDYKTDSDYALLWFSSDQVAIIELDQTLAGSSTRRQGLISEDTFNFSCQLSKYQLSGIDQSQRTWKICLLPQELSFSCQ